MSSKIRSQTSLKMNQGEGIFDDEILLDAKESGIQHNQTWT